MANRNSFSECWWKQCALNRLLESWTPEVVTPPYKKIVLEFIPKRTTGQIQLLNVFGFRIWKNFLRHFSDVVILSGSDIQMHLRNNIIKLQSLVHNLSSPRYINMFKNAWYKSGYIEKAPPEFINPVKFGFGDNSEPRCHICGAKNLCFSNTSLRSIIIVMNTFHNTKWRNW